MRHPQPIISSRSSCNASLLLRPGIHPYPAALTVWSCPYRLTQLYELLNSRKVEFERSQFNFSKMFSEIPYFSFIYSTQSCVCLLSLSVILSWLTWNRYHNGLHTIPGPFLASVSSFWKASVVWREDMPRRNTLLHEKFGPLVRIGPNHVSASSAEALQAVHRAKTGLNKGGSFVSRIT